MSENTRIIELLKYNFKEIEHLLEDKNVIEIMLNPDRKIWVDKLRTGREFTGIELNKVKAMTIINTIATSINKVIDEKNPILSAELPVTGSRFEAIIIGKNPTFTIRKKASLVFTLNDYVESGNLTEKQKEIIIKSIKNRKNILIVGGTSTGKTTFANACIDEMGKLDERLVILEDTEELQSNAKDNVPLKTTEYVGLRQLLKSTMRLRPDRIIVGEIRDEVALDLLTAWNSGHNGGLTTIHSDTAIGGLNQLEQYIQRISISKQSELIAKVIDLIIVLKRVGTERRVDTITELRGLVDKKYSLKEL